MTIYAVGDLQGCYDSLQDLLKECRFNADRDQLWLTGDLVNRGPDSRSTMEFVYERRDNIITVLGNHDLHMLACAHGTTKPRPKDTIDEVIRAQQADKWLDWLQQQPLVYWDNSLKTLLVHAGIPPIWSIRDSLSYAQEVEAILRGNNARAFFEEMYGNIPDSWDPALEGADRLRVITNYFTRMRFCTQDGKLDLLVKGEADKAPEGFTPWFLLDNKVASDEKILFGHWAALMGQTGVDNLIALDTGCVWGHELTALNLDSMQMLACDCHLASTDA